MKNGLPYYKAYPRDFIEGTIGMPFEMKCAYRVVLDLIYMQGGNLPDDPRYISGLLGCSIRKWKSIRLALIDAGKINVSGEFLTNERAIKELETLAKLQDNQREKASKTRKNKGLQQPQQSQPEPEPYRDTNVSLSKRAKAERFQEFWDQYPHRGGAKKARADCEKRYARHVAAGVPEQTIISAAIRYASDRQVLEGYAKNPATWLNQKGWEDEIEPVVPNPRNTGRSGPHDSLMAGFAAFANSDPGSGETGFGGGGSSDGSGWSDVDRGPSGNASQPILRVIGSD